MAKKILIVDDDAGNVKFLSVLLREHGYETMSACDGMEGIEKARKDKPDLMVLDVLMPRKTGLSFFISVKKERDLKDVPIIMLTAVSEVILGLAGGKTGDSSSVERVLAPKLKELVEKLRGDGGMRPDVFLDKPIEPDVLVNHVKRLIGPARDEE